MKAAQISTYGGPEVFEINDIPTPSAESGKIVVEVYSASINPFDYKVRRGYMKDAVPIQFPTTLGGDFAGIVTEAGDGVSEFKKGDEVYGSASVFGKGSGSFAQFANASVNNVALKPTTVSLEEAGALPLVGSSAVQALEEHIKLHSGQKILIHGGAGGIGHVAIQLAKAIGAYVITTVSTPDIDIVKQLGADKVIDYKTQKFEEIVKDVDAVFDTVGGETLQKSIGVIKKDGILVSMTGTPDENAAKSAGITAIGQMTNTNSDHLKRLAQLVDEGKINVHIDKVFSLDQIKEAFTYQEEIHPKGKVVIKIK